MQGLEALRMENIRMIELKGHIDEGNSVSFVRAELLPLGLGYTPFALIIFSINDQPQERGLRLDLDKRAFLDNLDNVDMRTFIERSAARIADFVQERYLSA
jgi:hypothetical protein